MFCTQFLIIIGIDEYFLSDFESLSSRGFSAAMVYVAFGIEFRIGYWVKSYSLVKKEKEPKKGAGKESK